MKKILIFIIFFIGVTLSQNRVTSWWLSDTGDSTASYNCQSEWLEIQVIDSTDQDTVYLQYPTVGGYVTIAVWNLSTGSQTDTLMSPGANENGGIYIVYAPYPRAVRFNMNSLAGELYIKVTEKPN